jgi:hypothetical protein
MLGGGYAKVFFNVTVDEEVTDPKLLYGVGTLRAITC